MVGMDGCWAGVDVGAERKGFHVAVVDQDGVVAGPAHAATPAAVVAWLEPHRPHLVAVDSPRRPAPHGERSRQDERDLARAVCGIRYTPDRAALARSPRYYAWVRHGFALYDALAAAGWEPVECFPTATWTRLGGPRGATPRGHWSRSVIAAQGLRRLPPTMGQDARDATGAALTARLHAQGRTEAFGEIVVPRASC